MRLNELKEVEHDLGPSNRYAEIRLDGIYSEAEMKGRFTAKVKLIALKGADTKTGRAVVRVYRTH